MGNLTRKLLQKAKKYSIDMEESGWAHYTTLPYTCTHSNYFSQWVGHLCGNLPGEKKGFTNIHFFQSSLWHHFA